MNKAELESKHLAELHELAAKANVPRYRMLRRAELIEKLAGGGGDASPKREGSRGERSERGERPPRGRRERPVERQRSSNRERSSKRERSSERDRSAGREARPEPAAQEAAPEPPKESAPSAPQPAAAEGARPKRRRRRRRFGRKGKGLRVHDLLLPPPGRQALVYGESRETCTALLREIAAELGGASAGPDPIALLVDPSPEELADWKREAPEAELVVAAQARHASDALAQAERRAESGEDVILLVDSLSRLDDAEAAKGIFDSGLTQATGSLTVVAALERQS